MRNYSINNLVLANRGHELDEYANRILNQEKKLIVIGNNQEIEEFYERLGHELDIRAFSNDVDEDGYQYGIPFVTLEKIEYLDDDYIICLSKERDKYEYLREFFKKKGYYENQSFFQGEIYSMVYEVYKKDKIKIDRIEIFLTSCCTLNCEKCIAYIPYFDRKVHTPIEELKRDADILFNKVDYVFKLKLLGGEGLLYPNLVEYIDYLHLNYGDKIGSIRIGTNGSIFPNQDILDMCRRDKVTLDISDYSKAVPQICKINEVKQLCENNGVNVDVKRTGEQWLDLGFPNNLPDKKDEKQLQEHFKQCAMFCRQFSKGKMYYCCSNFAAVCAKLFPENENDYFDFLVDFSKKELLEYEIGYSKLGHTSFCSVCRGCSEEVNPCHIEVAKQVEQKKQYA